MSPRPSPPAIPPTTPTVSTPPHLTSTHLSATLAHASGEDRKFIYVTSLPDGTPRQLLDVSRMQDLGWTALVNLASGIAMTYDQYENQAEGTW